MRIVVNDYLGHAPQVQLSRTLASRGHDVLHLYCSDIQTPKADLRRRPDDPAALSIEAVGLGRAGSGAFLAERWHETAIGRAVARRSSAFRADVVVGCNNPLDAQREIQKACRRSNTPFVYWMQDFYATQLDRAMSDRAAVLGLAAGSYYHWLERTLLQRSTAIVVVADDYLGILSEYWDVYDRQCMVVRNWAPLDAVSPGDKVNSWSQQHGLADKKVVLYAGALGSMEQPGLLAELAGAFAGRPDISVVAVSEGEGANRLAAEGKSRGLANLRVLPYQPYEAYSDVLASADVLVGMVSAQAGVLFVPSKVSSYLCAGRPVVLAAPWQNLAAQAVRESDGGRVVAPDDTASCSQAVLGYLDDAALGQRAGQQARLYAEKTFDIAAITDRFERLFERLRTGPVRRRQQMADSLAVPN